MPRLAIPSILVLVFIAACVAMLGQQRAQAATPPPFVLIVNPENAASVADREFLEDAFLKKVTTWPNGDVIRPADLPADSPVRRAFTRAVLNRSVEAVKGYWQQRIFSGRDVPPPELESDEEVVKFVLKHAGGVGYVSGTAKLEGCKPLGVR
jgi:ABC-type phosphate transport system substrate-binding protein